MNVAQNQVNSGSEAASILVLGATGMLGSAVLRFLAASSGCKVVGTTRTAEATRLLPGELLGNLLSGIDVESPDGLVRAFDAATPSVVINCIGLVKQLPESHDPFLALSINALLPHRLARLCRAAGARLVHVSTDCVFSGDRGNYTEADFADADDLYGRSKYLGEVDYQHAITLRTSIIGHELRSAHGLVGWFLSQQGSVKGFTRALFSGLPTVELARVIRDVVLPRPQLRGLYHVAAEPIDKCTLLQKVAVAYGKQIEIVRDDALKIDRSLSATRFRDATGYVAPSWDELIARMQQFH